MPFEFAPSTQKYIPLPLREPDTDSSRSTSIDEKSTSNDIEHQRASYSRFSLSLYLATLTRWLPWLLVGFLALSNVVAWRRARASEGMWTSVYSPAQHLLKPQEVLFTSGIEDSLSPYQGYPDEANNKLWEELYDFGVDKIPMSEAAKLVNRTSLIPDDPDNYVVILDVFHQLHCLNWLRLSIFHDYVNSTEPLPGLLHMDHCIDSLRQSLMCSADITPISYAWWPKYEALLPATGMVHTCRDFEALRRWARENQASEFDERERPRRDPLGDVVHISPPGRNTVAGHDHHHD